MFASRLNPAELSALNELGVVGYLLWGDLAPETLPHCLATMLIGKAVLRTRSVAAAFAGAWSCSPRPCGDRVRLTEREQAVLRRLAEGLTHEEIAQLEPLSLRTVDRIVATLEAKLDAPSQFVLGLKAAQFGLLR